jgi:hypothetical protein
MILVVANHVARGLSRFRAGGLDALTCGWHALRSGDHYSGRHDPTGANADGQPTAGTRVVTMRDGSVTQDEAWSTSSG